MVVGNVQSGKTANYTGLINKATDAGYKLIIVIAGIHNALRSQTQVRIDEGYIGRNSSDFIEFYGSSSEEANQKHYGGLSDYRSSEGKKVQISYRGKLDDTIRDILGGIRSSCTYVGAPTLKQLSKCTTFVRVNNQYNDVFGKV